MKNVYIAVLVMAAFFVRRSITTAMFGPLTGSVSHSIPADFPSDVPLPPDATCEEASKRAGIFQVELTVKQPVTSVVRFYESELASRGWQVERMGSDDRDAGQYDGVSASKDGHMLAALVMPRNGGSAEVSLTVR
jgi:hypothetical protein